MKSHFGDEERFLRNTFAGEERLRGMKREFGGKRLGTNTCLGSLTSKTKRDFGE
jgi:hypothetical protein